MAAVSVLYYRTDSLRQFPVAHELSGLPHFLLLGAAIVGLVRSTFVRVARPSTEAPGGGQSD
jgi:hypothetical protein